MALLTGRSFKTFCDYFLEHIHYNIKLGAHKVTQRVREHVDDDLASFFLFGSKEWLANTRCPHMKEKMADTV